MTKEEAYKKFFQTMWERYCEQELDFDMADDMLTIWQEVGLVKEEPYDPAIHGEGLGGDWDIEEGQPCYVLVK